MRASFDEAREVLARLGKKQAEVRSFQPAAMQSLLDQARVASEHLTGSHEWNVFLQRIQVWVDQERRALQVMGESLALPNLTSEQVLQGQRHMLVAKARLEAWEQVIQLPKEIIETASKSATA